MVSQGVVGGRFTERDCFSLVLLRSEVPFLNHTERLSQYRHQRAVRQSSAELVSGFCIGIIPSAPVPYPQFALAYSKDESVIVSNFRIT